MLFWHDVLFEDENAQRYNFTSDVGQDERAFHTAQQQVQHWLERNSRIGGKARALLADYAKNHGSKPPGMTPPIAALNRKSPEGDPAQGHADDPDDEVDDPKRTEKITPFWNADEPDK